MIGKVNGSNTKRYIYKNGVFYIEPTLNNFTNSGGVLKNGNLLSIPYVVSGKTIYFKIRYVTTVAWQKFHSTNAPSLVYTDYQVAELFFQFMADSTACRGIRTISIPSNKLIGIGGYQTNYGYEILEIWTENTKTQ